MNADRIIEGMKALLLFLFLFGTARWGASYTPTPYTEENCSGDNAIWYDGDIFYDDVQLNEERLLLFDFSSVKMKKPNNT